MAESRKQPDRVVLLGRVAAPFGVQGWIKIQPYTAGPGGLENYAEFLIGKDKNHQRYSIEKLAIHGRSVLCKLQNCDDREQAAKLKGFEVGVLRSELPEGQADEYYWTDLIGMQVVNMEGAKLGTITQMIDNGAQSVMVVGGERERFIPFVPAHVVEVVMREERVVVDWGTDF